VVRSSESDDSEDDGWEPSVEGNEAVVDMLRTERSHPEPHPRNFI
jgi:hypothetical protein